MEETIYVTFKVQFDFVFEVWFSILSMDIPGVECKNDCSLYLHFSYLP